MGVERVQAVEKILGETVLGKLLWLQLRANGNCTSLKDSSIGNKLSRCHRVGSKRTFKFCIHLKNDRIDCAQQPIFNVDLFVVIAGCDEKVGVLTWKISGPAVDPIVVGIRSGWDQRLGNE